MLLIILTYLVLALLFVVPVVSIYYIVDMYEKQAEELRQARFLPKLDLAIQIAYLTFLMKHQPSEPVDVALQGAKNILGLAIEEYPYADWDSWWTITTQLIDMYENRP